MQVRKLFTNQNAETVVNTAESGAVGLIFAMFMGFITEAAHVVLFPFTGILGLARSGLLIWRQAKAGKSQTDAKVRLALEIVASLVIGVAVLGGFLWANAFVLAAPIMFTATLAVKTMHTLVMACIYSYKALHEENPILKKQHKQIAKDCFIGFIGGAFVTAAAGLVMIGGWVWCSLLGLGGAAIGVGFGGHALLKAYREKTSNVRKVSPVPSPTSVELELKPLHGSESMWGLAVGVSDSLQSPASAIQAERCQEGGVAGRKTSAENRIDDLPGVVNAARTDSQKAGSFIGSVSSADSATPDSTAPYFNDVAGRIAAGRHQLLASRSTYLSSASQASLATQASSHLPKAIQDPLPLSALSQSQDLSVASSQESFRMAGTTSRLLTASPLTRSALPSPTASKLSSAVSTPSTALSLSQGPSPSPAALLPSIAPSPSPAALLPSIAPSPSPLLEATKVAKLPSKRNVYPRLEPLTSTSLFPVPEKKMRVQWIDGNSQGNVSKIGVYGAPEGRSDSASSDGSSVTELTTLTNRGVKSQMAAAPSNSLRSS